MYVFGYAELKYTISNRRYAMSGVNSIMSIVLDFVNICNVIILILIEKK